MKTNVLKVKIDPEIELDEKRIVGMPDDIKGRLLVTMTIFCERNSCHWTELKWTVKPNGVISVNKR